MTDKAKAKDHVVVVGEVIDQDDGKRIQERYEHLTPKQKRWLDAFMINRNRTQSARIAGYSGGDPTMRKVGSDNAKNLKEIIDYMDNQSSRVVELIADLEGIYKFWGVTMTDNRCQMKDRLKASELLARALGAFAGEQDHVHRIDANPFKGLDTKDLQKLAKQLPS